ncbi:GrpB family protein [Labrenzia sp. CE80]|uniref:GrpB family protein n=1 Tax=Labrenzia sp. CE80 TaxID=1788986 RepID=UPI0013894BBD|nr:GrpB family protein [Labrenzia sp. CE80]
MSIELGAYTPLRDQQANALMAQVRLVLEDLTTHIDHVGSTAVKNLAAKPKFHLDVILEDANHLDEAVSRLVAAEYSPLGFLYECDVFHLTFADRNMPEEDGVCVLQPAHRICLCFPDALAPLRRAAFRDALSADGNLRRDYEALKHRLIAQDNQDWHAYSVGKTQFIETTLRNLNRTDLGFADSQ